MKKKITPTWHRISGTPICMSIHRSRDIDYRDTLIATVSYHGSHDSVILGPISRVDTTYGLKVCRAISDKFISVLVSWTNQNITITPLGDGRSITLGITELSTEAPVNTTYYNDKLLVITDKKGNDIPVEDNRDYHLITESDAIPPYTLDPLPKWVPYGGSK